MTKPRFGNMPPHEEYSGIDFAVGSITAARTFRLDKHSRLIGNYDQVWRPGENVARCPRGCSGIEDDCTCGFWAYHDPSAATGYGSPYLAAVIEGYGTVVVGTKGIRCSKAKIIGLAVYDAWDRTRLLRNYPDLNIVWSHKKLRKLMRYDSAPTADMLGEEFWTRDTEELLAPEKKWPRTSYASGGMTIGYSGNSVQRWLTGASPMTAITWGYDSGGNVSGVITPSSAPVTPAAPVISDDDDDS